MPIYDYACDQCRHRFEARQSFADEPLTICPECQGHIRRVIHPSGIIFKGSGWYVTDSRDKKSAAAPAAGGSADTSSSDSAETSSADTKPAKASAPESKAAADE